MKYYDNLDCVSILYTSLKKKYKLATLFSRICFIPKVTHVFTYMPNEWHSFEPVYLPWNTHMQLSFCDYHHDFFFFFLHTCISNLFRHLSLIRITIADCNSFMTVKCTFNTFIFIFSSPDFMYHCNKLWISVSNCK